MKKTTENIIFLRCLPKVLVWGGLEKIIMDWFERIDHTSCRVTLVVNSKEWVDHFKMHFEDKHFPIEIIQFPFSLNDGPIKLLGEMYHFLRSLNPAKIIFVQGAFSDFRFSAVLAGFLASRNNSYMHENLEPPAPIGKYSGQDLVLKLKNFRKRTLQIFLNFSRTYLTKNVISVSHDIKDQLTRFWGYPSSRVKVFYHGIDLTKFKISSNKRQQIRQSLGIHDRDFIFIVPARLSKEKRIDRIIESFDRLSVEHDNLWLLIAGEGPLKQDLQQLADQKRSKNKIIFLGQKENIEDYLNAADCYVNASDKEGLCLALLEAMACGLVCIATPCAGPTEIIKNSQGGFLVEKNIDGITDGMNKTLKLGNKERDEIIARGMTYVFLNFDVNKSAMEALDAMQIPNIYRKNRP